MMAHLWLYFGVVGIASVFSWAVAGVILAGGARRENRTTLYRIAMAAATAGFLLARINSHFVSAIEVDRSEEYAKAMERQKDLRKELDQEQQTRAAKIRFVEDTPADALDMAGVSTSRTESVGSALAPDDPAKYAYRQRGKQVRTVDPAASTNEGGLRQVTARTGPSVNVRQARQLPERDVINANRMDRINLFFSRLMFWLACLLLVWDYLVRFNRTFDYLYPLPIAHPLIDTVWPKRYAVSAEGLTPEALRRYLQDVIRKGETFIYFGETEPWPGLRSLPRWRFGKWCAGRVEVVTVGAGRMTCDDEFIFDSAWFHRYAFVITRAAAPAKRLGAITELLSMRLGTHARARRTLNLVWACQAHPPVTALADLVNAGRPANVKFLLVGPVPPGIRCDEVCR